MDEGDGYVEVCFLTTMGHTEPIDVEITPVRKEVDNPALPGNYIKLMISDCQIILLVRWHAIWRF